MLILVKSEVLVDSFFQAAYLFDTQTGLMYTVIWRVHHPDDAHEYGIGEAVRLSVSSGNVVVTDATYDPVTLRDHEALIFWKSLRQLAFKYDQPDVAADMTMISDMVAGSLADRQVEHVLGKWLWFEREAAPAIVSCLRNLFELHTRDVIRLGAGDHVEEMAAVLDLILGEVNVLKEENDG